MRVHRTVVAITVGLISTAGWGAHTAFTHHPAEAGTGIAADSPFAPVEAQFIRTPERLYADPSDRAPAQPTDDADDDDQIVQPPIALPSCPGGPSVHFDTPEAAMTYLASAWNRNDLAALCQVTNPNARFLLNDMHREAVNLTLDHCRQDAVGQYTCMFRHDYPRKMHQTGVGHAQLAVASASDPGWYMTVYEGCG